MRFLRNSMYKAVVQYVIRSCIRRPMNDENHVKSKIKKVLLDHPEGLHILGIAKLVGVHRHTVTKYIHELIGAGVIYQREIGTVKICYLSQGHDTKTVSKSAERLKNEL